MFLDPVTMQSVFWYSAIIGTIVFLLKIVLPTVGGTEITGDFTSIADTDASFHLLTIESIAAFFMSFGWIGWVGFTQMHIELKVAMLIAVIFGLLGFFLFAWLLSLVKKMEQTVEYDLTTLVDKVGKAYLHFEPKGSGKIQIEFNDKLETMSAMNNSDIEIEAFSQVKVVKVENNVIYVEKI